MPRVMVRASADEFTFSTDTASVSVAPVVWYNSAGQVSAFGIDRALPPELRRLDLFPLERRTTSVESVVAPLKHFLTYHFELVARRAGAPWWQFILRPAPEVVFTEVRGFDGRIDEAPRTLLTRACRAAGARQVEFL